MASKSLEPSLKQGQYFLSIRKYGDFPKIERTYLVLYKPNGNFEEMDFVGRVIGLPNESIMFKDGHIYIKEGDREYQLEEKYLVSDIYNTASEENEWINLKADEYLILTDIRGVPVDLREKIVKKQYIVGIVSKVF